jgi:parallel beta-helix repeat protein
MTSTRTRAATARRAALVSVLALGGTLMLGSTGAAAAGAVTIIPSCGYTITARGTYMLATDLTCQGETTAITIAANNVELLLGKHTLDGGDGDGVVANGVRGLRIVGGTISGFNGRAIDITNARGVLIAGVTEAANTGGIVLESCVGCLVVGCRTSDSDVGISLSGSSPNTQIAGNTATRNNVIGIQVLAGTQGVRLTGNVATDNQGVDLLDANLPGSCVNIWRGNSFETDNETGAAFGPGAGCIR